jgi:phenylalanyl-tRNA synthetase beta chain
MEALFNRLGIKDYDFQAASGAGAQIIASGQKLGRMFALSKEALERAGIKNKDVFCLEVSLEKILELAHLEKKFLALPKYPAVERDISFVLKDDVPVSRVLAQVKEKGAPFLVEVKISDYYKGKQIPAGYRGLTVSCFYRAGNRTLTEAQIQPLHEGICALLTERFSAQIR